MKYSQLWVTVSLLLITKCFLSAARQISIQSSLKYVSLLFSSFFLWLDASCFFQHSSCPHFPFLHSLCSPLLSFLSHLLSWCSTFNTVVPPFPCLLTECSPFLFSLSSPPLFFFLQTRTSLDWTTSLAASLPRWQLAGFLSGAATSAEAVSEQSRSKRVVLSNNYRGDRAVIFRTNWTPLHSPPPLSVWLSAVMYCSHSRLARRRSRLPLTDSLCRPNSI